MNFLAHLLLTDHTAEALVGSVLPDLLRGHRAEGASAKVRRYMQLHHEIDAFTDRHPTVLASCRLVRPDLARYAGVVVDVFYDHLLACGWAAYAPVPLPAFAAHAYAEMATLAPTLPPPAQAVLARMRVNNWLLRYPEPDGVAEALARLSARSRRDIRLEAAMGDLAAHRVTFTRHFAEFFPQLLRHTAHAHSLAPAAGPAGHTGVPACV